MRRNALRFFLFPLFIIMFGIGLLLQFLVRLIRLVASQSRLKSITSQCQKLVRR